MEGTVFPVYRKYKNNASWFKIHSESRFDEVKKMPSGYAFFEFEAKILPDRNFIYDMLYQFHDNWEECSEQDFENVRERVNYQL